MLEAIRLRNPMRLNVQVLISAVAAVAIIATMVIWTSKSPDVADGLDPATTPAAVPEAPKFIERYTTVGDGTITVHWLAPDLAGHPPITNYQLEYLESGKRWDVEENWAFVNAGAVDSYTIRGLTNGRRYFIFVCALNAIGYSPWSDPPVVASPKAIWMVPTPTPTSIPIPVSAPSEPINVRFTSGEGWINVAWEMPRDTGGSPITNYQIAYRNAALPNTDANWTFRWNRSTDLNHNTYGLNNDTQYYIYVRAFNSAGEYSP